MLKKEFNAHHSVINQLLKIHQKGEFFSSSTLTVWSSSADGTVKIWDTKEHNVKKKEKNKINRNVTVFKK